MSNPDFIENNRITLLRNGDEYFPRLEAAIESAHSEIYLETYIFAADATGHRIAVALQRAALRGVSVHVLLDGFGSQHLPQQILQNLLQAGVKVLIFRPEIAFTKFRRYRLRRMHRKLTIIDASIAFVGGINIIDDQHNPENLSPRLDYAVAIQGPLLAQVHKAARHLWMIVAWVHFKRRWIAPIAIVPSNDPCGTQKAAFIIRDNWRHRHDIEHAYLQAIQYAHTEIIIANAYFLPGKKFATALKSAVKRGVRVILLLQGKVEYRLQYHATQAMYKNLLQAGIHIFEYNRSYLHAKVAVIDQNWSTVGSSNIDPFSLLLAREANVVIADPDFAQELRRSLHTTIADESEAVTINSQHIFSWHRNMLNTFCFYIVRLLQGILGYDWHDNN